MHCNLWPNIPLQGTSLGHANLQKLKVLEPEKQQCNELIESIGQSENVRWPSEHV